MRVEALMDILCPNNELDPVYLAVKNAPISTPQKQRALVCWMSYHHLGLSFALSGLKDAAFWKKMIELNDVAPRANERRHFRGAASLKALKQWATMYPHPEDMCETLWQCAPEYSRIRKFITSHLQFGDYFVWKVCDMYQFMTGRRINMVAGLKHLPNPVKAGVEEISLDTQPHGGTIQVFSRIKAHAVAKGYVSSTGVGFGYIDAETICCIYRKLKDEAVPGGRIAENLFELESFPSESGNLVCTDMLDRCDRVFSVSDLRKAYEKCHVVKSYEKHCRDTARKYRSACSL